MRFRVLREHVCGTHEGLLSWGDSVLEDIAACDDLCEISGGSADFLFDVLGRLASSLGAWSTGD